MCINSVWEQSVEDHPSPSRRQMEPVYHLTHLFQYFTRPHPTVQCGAWVGQLCMRWNSAQLICSPIRRERGPCRQAIHTQTSCNWMPVQWSSSDLTGWWGLALTARTFSCNALILLFQCPRNCEVSDQPLISYVEPGLLMRGSGLLVRLFSGL